ncbi:MAG: carbohydrate ABC transporter permease, partial [Pseudomonadota bacterium]
MFPRPIEKSAPSAQVAYKVALPIALLVWLLPLLAIFMTSIRTSADITAGNVFGIPTEFAFFQNYWEVLSQPKALDYMINTLIITVPTVAVSVGLACLTGYALAVYKFRYALPLFFVFVAGNFVPFQILM